MRSAARTERVVVNDDTYAVRHNLETERYVCRTCVAEAAAAVTAGNELAVRYVTFDRSTIDPDDDDGERAVVECDGCGTKLYEITFHYPDTQED